MKVRKIPIMNSMVISDKRKAVNQNNMKKIAFIMAVLMMVSIVSTVLAVVTPCSHGLCTVTTYNYYETVDSNYCRHVVETVRKCCSCGDVSTEKKTDYKVSHSFETIRKVNSGQYDRCTRCGYCTHFWHAE